MSGYSIERTYPADQWRTNPRAILTTFRQDATTEALQHGRALEDSESVTGYLEDDDGTPNARTPARIRIVATWSET